MTTTITDRTQDITSPYGLIGYSGRFYPCKLTKHAETAWANGDAPYVYINPHAAEFPAYYTAAKTTPSTNQFNTLMDWCTVHKRTFESITDCWELPWQKWRS